MSRGHGWRFLDMGRRLERAVSLALTIDATVTTAQPAEPLILESLLEAADSAITYRRRYLASLHAAPVLDLLLTDPTNPRSVVFQLGALLEHVVKLPHLPGRARDGIESALAGGADALLSRLEEIERAPARRGRRRRAAARPRGVDGRARARAARALGRPHGELPQPRDAGAAARAPRRGGRAEASSER